MLLALPLVNGASTAASRSRANAAPCLPPRPAPARTGEGRQLRDGLIGDWTVQHQQRDVCRRRDANLTSRDQLSKARAAAHEPRWHSPSPAPAMQAGACLPASQPRTVVPFRDPKRVGHRVHAVTVDVARVHRGGNHLALLIAVASGVWVQEVSAHAEQRPELGRRVPLAICAVHHALQAAAGAVMAAAALVPCHSFEQAGAGMQHAGSRRQRQQQWRPRTARSTAARGLTCAAVSTNRSAMRVPA